MGDNMNVILSTDPLLKCINVLYTYNKNCIPLFLVRSTVFVQGLCQATLVYYPHSQAPPSFCCLQYGKEGKVWNFSHVIERMVERVSSKTAIHTLLSVWLVQPQNIAENVCHF